MNRNLQSLVPLLLLLVMVTGSSLAQSRQTSPSLTTEDVQRRNPAALVTATGTVQNNQQAESFTAAEIAWNERYQRARQRVRELERQADQAELAVARARNAYFNVNQPHDAQELNRLNNEQTRQAARSKQLRAEAAQAAVELNALLDEARREGFQVRTFALFKSNGEPDADSFRDRFIELKQELQDAEARAAVMDLRTRRAHTNLRVNACVGLVNSFNCADIYYVNRQRAELQTAQEELTAAQSRIAAVRKQIAELVAQGREAGLPQGWFN